LGSFFLGVGGDVVFRISNCLNLVYINQHKKFAELAFIISYGIYAVVNKQVYPWALAQKLRIRAKAQILFPFSYTALKDGASYFEFINKPK